MKRFALLAAFIAVPFGVFVAMTVADNPDAGQSEAMLRRSASDVAAQLDSKLIAVQDSLLALAASPQMLQDNPAVSIRALQAMARKLGLPLALTLPDNQEIVVTPDSDVILRQPIASTLLPDLQTVSLRKAPFVTTAQPRLTDNTAGVAVIIPLNAGARAANLMAMLRANQLVAGPVLTRWRVMIFDRDGNMLDPAGVYRPKDDEAAGVVRTALGQVSGNRDILHVQLDGAPVMMASGHTSVAGFSTSVAMPEHALNTATAGSEPTVIYAVGFAALLTSLVGAWFVLQVSPPEQDARLADQDVRLRGLLSTVQQAAFMVTDDKECIRFWSEGCVRMFGWSAAEVAGRNAAELLRREPNVEVPLYDESWSGEIVHRRRDGSHIVTAMQRVMPQPANRSGLAVSSLLDVTTLRNATETVRAATLSQADEQRATNADHVRALGLFAGGIAHDFNNILQAIAGSAALIARHPENPDLVSRFGSIISEAAARGAAITRRVLLLARRADLKTAPVDPIALLSGIKDVFVYTLGPNIAVELDITEHLPCLIADKVQLEVALANLATNARDAMPTGGTLRLQAGVDAVSPTTPHPARLPVGDYVRLSLIDTGVGMSDAALARVGEPFFTTKGIGKGTGLGLSMVKGFAEQSGGGFAMESTLGAGTTAHIWLPIASESETPNPCMPVLTDDVAQILLVDDDPDVRDTVTVQLEQLGHIVLSAAGGSDALAILRARKAIDLMITDLSMPGMNGLALIEQARDVRPSLPAILLTGYSAHMDTVAGGNRRPQDFTLVPKPASTKMLQARITELLGRE